MPEPKETLRHKVFRHLDVQAWPGGGMSPLNRAIVVLILAAVLVAVLQTEPGLRDAAPLFFTAFDWLAGLVFTLEYGLRLWSKAERPEYAGWRRLRWMLTPAALIDLLAVVPFWLALGADSSYLLRLARLLRVFRLTRLGRYSTALRTVVAAVAERRFELLVSVGVAFGFLILASALLYFVEGEQQPEAFGSIPRAMWWGVVTLTTIGYGDAYPVTVVGRICAGFIAFIAIGLVAMPTGILAAAFSDAFQRHRAGADRDRS